MILLPDVLSPAQAGKVCEGLAAAPFRDGRATAGDAAAPVKDNLQAHGDDPAVIALARQVRLALDAHPTMRRLARPARWSNLIFSRYGPGQQYGLHADNAGMSDEHGWPLRTDLSFTLFLSDPETYEGGALVIEDLAGERAFRPPAGAAVLYPTGRLHRVAPVTAGERLACVGWVQSQIRNADQREALYDLEQVRDTLPPGEGALRLDKTIGALLRMWAQD
ncbi:Fe2+-dependent dioxygenase [Phenylobacterium sp.]|uniref:Fe2+-dependent dioxygenase n=1 Tax=Phenylobacterium sp. TaxID=1871053 RepID=UPI0027313C65|nr:Fe2+-dependent dioxygenase [Phenylobacterium sp.]MDP1873148.1 Fe2+-dependent dioxygenase [Phenylobacterium sp.]